MLKGLELLGMVFRACVDFVRHEAEVGYSRPSCTHPEQTGSPLDCASLTALAKNAAVVSNATPHKESRELESVSSVI